MDVWGYYRNKQRKIFINNKPVGVWGVGWWGRYWNSKLNSPLTVITNTMGRESWWRKKTACEANICHLSVWKKAQVRPRSFSWRGKMCFHIGFIYFHSRERLYSVVPPETSLNMTGPTTHRLQSELRRVEERKKRKRTERLSGVMMQSSRNKSCAMAPILTSPRMTSPPGGACCSS